MNTSLLYILFGIGAGTIFLTFVTKRNKPSRKFSFDIITNFFLIIILTWKLLPVILAPVDIISNPISILYASGGTVGIGLGIGIGIVYLVIKLFLYGKHSVRNMHACSLQDGLKPVIVFFTVAGIVSSSLFFVSWMVRNGDVENNRTEDVRSYVSTGDMAPDFELMDTDGNLISLDEYRGKWVILNFWATWCPPCRAELPTLNRFYEGMDIDNVVLLGINATGTERITGECRDVACYVSTFAVENGISFPILLDTKGMVSAVYGAGTLPTTVVVSPEGVITKFKTGVVDSFWLRSVVSGN